MRAAWAHPKRTELNRMGSKGTATRPLSSGNVLNGTVLNRRTGPS